MTTTTQTEISPPECRVCGRELEPTRRPSDFCGGESCADDAAADAPQIERDGHGGFTR